MGLYDIIPSIIMILLVALFLFLICETTLSFVFYFTGFLLVITLINVWYLIRSKVDTTDKEYSKGNMNPSNIRFNDSDTINTNPINTGIYRNLVYNDDDNKYNNYNNNKYKDDNNKYEDGNKNKNLTIIETLLSTLSSNRSNNSINSDTSTNKYPVVSFIQDPDNPDNPDNSKKSIYPKLNNLQFFKK